MFKEKKVGIIILNYINYLETEGCVKSVLKQKYCNYYILVVDNGSNNESYDYLKKLFMKEERVSVIKTGKNYGFAKGNNIGIQYMKKSWEPEYILLLNSDIILDEPYYIKRIVNADEEDAGIIGSTIIQWGEKKVLKKIYRYVTFPGTLFYYGKLMAENKNAYILQYIFERMLYRCKGDYILQGCALLLTPQYLKYYKGLDPRTFLYCEEELLFLRCRKVGLKEKLVEDLSILHKGKQSSQELYDNGRKKFLKYLRTSYKYVVLESIKDILNVSKKNNKMII